MGARRAHREPSFGMDVLDVKSATEAEWTWARNQKNGFVNPKTRPNKP